MYKYHACGQFGCDTAAHVEVFCNMFWFAPESVPCPQNKQKPPRYLYVLFASVAVNYTMSVTCVEYVMAHLVCRTYIGLLVLILSCVLQESTEKIGRLTSPIALLAFPFYLRSRTPGKEGSHYDPKSPLFVPSEGPLVGKRHMSKLCYIQESNCTTRTYQTCIVQISTTSL